MRHLDKPRTPERLNSMNQQLLNAGAIGFAKGFLIALTSGAYFNYRYNEGRNAAYFKTPYKVWWVVLWGIVGITFQTETAKNKIVRDFAVEENIRRNEYIRENKNCTIEEE